MSKIANIEAMFQKQNPYSSANLNPSKSSSKPGGGK
jgi:hypothetical protein